MPTINLGSANVTAVTGIKTTNIHRRRDCELPRGFSKELDKAYDTERGF